MAKKKINTEFILSVDIGFSNVKYCYYSEDGVLQFDKYISAIAKIPDPLTLDNDSLFQLGLDYYLISTPALKVDRNLLLPMETFENLMEVYPIHVSYLLNKFNKEGRNVNRMVLGLSLAFKDRADELLDHLYNTLCIEPSTNFFSILPQGLSAKIAYSEVGSNIKEIAKRNETKMESFGIVDGGFNSVDVAICIGQNAAAAAVGLANTGVINIAFNLKDYLYKQYGLVVSVKEAQTIIDSEDKVLVRRGRVIDLSEEVDKFSKKYLVDVLNLIEERFGNYLDNLDGILFCGGIAYYINRYKESIRTEIEKHFPMSFIHTPEILSEYYNCYSYMKIAEKMIQQ